VASRFESRLRAEGTEPDPRFSLANERTFLAYLRTALALLAAGAGVLKVEVFAARAANLALGLGLVLLGAAVSGMSYRRWRAVEVAMRRQQPLPYSPGPLLLAIALTAAGVAAAVLALVT
jgi:putative membrane protein